MKTIGKIGLLLGSLTLIFGLYLMFVVAPASESAELERERIANTIMMEDLAEGQSYFDVPGYEDAFNNAGKKVEYGQYVFLGSMLPLLLCLIAVFKRDKMAMIGLAVSLAAFLIGAAYGTHMFS